MEEYFKAIKRIKEPLLEWEKWVRRIAYGARKVLGKCRVIVFGSVVEGRATGGSDVDVLIITGKKFKALERARILVMIEENSGLPLYHPFEIHLVDEGEVRWYMRHIKRYIEIEVS